MVSIILLTDTPDIDSPVDAHEYLRFIWGEFTIEGRLYFRQCHLEVESDGVVLFTTIHSPEGLPKLISRTTIQDSDEAGVSNLNFHCSEDEERGVEILLNNSPSVHDDIETYLEER